ncbi:MAG: DUF269 domain-containing protein, partial [Thiohalomonadaceae bacterium]
MHDTALAITPDDPVLASDFARELVKQMRAVDSYGMYEQYTSAQVLDPFVLTEERRRSIPVVADPDEIVLSRVNAY